MSSKKIIVFKNKDKDRFSKHKKDLNNFQFPYSFVLLMCIRKNGGKTNLVKNIMYHQKPIYNRIILINYLKDSNEYDDIDIDEENDHYNNIPDVDDLNLADERTIIIIEDIDIKHLPRNEKTSLITMLGALSSHNGVSIIICLQEPTMIDVSIRRLCDMTIIGRSPDDVYRESVHACLGIPRKILNYFDDFILKEQHDTILIDKNDNKIKYRKNITEPLNI